MKHQIFSSIRNLLLSSVVFFITASHAAVTETERNPASPLTVGFSYTGDVIFNLSGGIRTGTGYIGLGSITADFLTEAGRMWRGGEVRLRLSCTHGQNPSALLTGDLQGISNIAAGNHLFLQELYFRQTLGKWKVTLGLQDMNAEFVTLPSAGSFLNSSFGIPPLLTGNHPVPVFPLTALGISLSFDLSGRISFKGAVFDGNPVAFDKNPHNLYWSPTHDHGMLITGETEFRTGSAERPGSVKAGFCFHTGTVERDGVTGELLKQFTHETSMYLLAEKLLFKAGETHFTGFSQVAFSPATQTPLSYYSGMGLRAENLFPSLSCEEAGIALAHAGIRECLHACETAIEVYCRLRPGKYWYLQPDLQYIIHPSGTEMPLPNAVVMMIRAGIELQGN